MTCMPHMQCSRIYVSMLPPTHDLQAAHAVFKDLRINASPYSMLPPTHDLTCIASRTCSVQGSTYQCFPLLMTCMPHMQCSRIYISMLASPLLMTSRIYVSIPYQCFPLLMTCMPHMQCSRIYVSMLPPTRDLHAVHAVFKDLRINAAPYS